jgi:hypothetical protein
LSGDERRSTFRRTDHTSTVFIRRGNFRRWSGHQRQDYRHGLTNVRNSPDKRRVRSAILVFNQLTKMRASRIKKIPDAGTVDTANAAGVSKSTPNVRAGE